MLVRCCRDCASFEDRRDIEDVALCARNVGPYVCCDEFEPRDKGVNANRLYNRFCAECASFEDVNGISLCAKNHTPLVACEEFRSRFEKLEEIRQDNHAKTAFLTYAARENPNPKPAPDYLIEIGRRIKW